MGDLMEVKGGAAAAFDSSDSSGGNNAANGGDNDATTTGSSSDGSAAGPPAPRASNAAGIPGMLQMFQTEWDTLMLETFTLRQHLETVRQELSHALYQHDAACRVIARLVKERDEARMAIAKSGQQTTTTAATGGGDTKAYRTNLSKAVLGNVTQTAERLSAKRRRRKVARDLLPMDTIGKFEVTATQKAQSGQGVRCVDVHPENDNMV